MVIGYQIDEFTCTWSAEWFVAHSHIYPGFTGKVSSLTHFPLLSDMCGSLFSMVIMLSPLIYRMLIYIFLLLSIINISYGLFGTTWLISGRFYLLGWPHPLAFSQPSLNSFDSFAIARVSILLSIWMTSWFWLCWDTLHMSVSLPPDKLADIQQLVLSLLQNQHITVHRVMSFLGKANFCTNDHSQLWLLCCVIQSDMLTIYNSPTHLFSHVHFSLSSLHQLEWLSHLQQSPIPLQFPLPDVVIATDAMPTHWAFYFQGSGLPLSVVDSGQVLCLGLILSYRSFRPFPWSCIEWLSTYLVRWLACIGIMALLRLTCVINVVQCLLFFPG